MRNPMCKNCGGRDWLLYKSVDKTYYTQIKDGEKNKWIENSSKENIEKRIECAKCGGEEIEDHNYKIVKKRGDHVVIFVSKGLDRWLE
jgi:cytochrome c-type biogenesis protein CcmH/NrfF